MLPEVEAVLRGRMAALRRDREAALAGSYSATLLDDSELARRKIMEEAFELCLELGRADTDAFDPARVAAEAADLLFHTLAGLVGAGVGLDAVFGELQSRRSPATAP